MGAVCAALSDFASGCVSSSGSDGGGIWSVDVFSSSLLPYGHTLLFVPVLFVQQSGSSFRKAYQSVFDTGCQFSGTYLDRFRSFDASPMYVSRYILAGCSLYSYQCHLCDGTCDRRCFFYLYIGWSNHNYSAYSDWRTWSDDTDQFFCHVLYGKYFAL